MRYAAFFRGINVGGKNIVNMAALKELFISLGFGQVRTYIQSGNVVFDTAETSDMVADQINRSFAHKFGFASALMLRTGDEMDEIIRNLPFAAQEIAEAEAANANVVHLYVYLLDEAPDQDAVNELCAAYTGADLLRVGKRELYLLCHQSIRDSKLTASLAKLKAPMTARNLNTINKIYEMMSNNDGAGF